VHLLDWRDLRNDWGFLSKSDQETASRDFALQNLRIRNEFLECIVFSRASRYVYVQPFFALAFVALGSTNYGVESSV